MTDRPSPGAVAALVLATLSIGASLSACGGQPAALPTVPAGAGALAAPEVSPPPSAPTTPTQPSVDVTGSAAAAPSVAPGAAGEQEAAAAAPVAPPPVRTPPDDPTTGGPSGSDVRDVELYAFSCDDSEAKVAASGAPHVSTGQGAVYVGAQQVSGDNQDPRVVRFRGGEQMWCRDDLETSGDDGRAYGLLWEGDRLYVAFSAVGTQGDPGGDLRRFTGQGWLTSYSDASPSGGGGAKASAVVRLDPETGDGIEGTWLTAVNGDGKTNSLVVTSMALTGDGLLVGTDSWYSPRGTDRQPLTCSGSSPFDTTYTFTPDLTSVVAVGSDGCG